MQAIRILRGCGASGQSLEAGRVYAVPSEVSASDAALLVRIGKAEAHEPQSSAAVSEQRFDTDTGIPAPVKRKKKGD